MIGDEPLDALGTAVSRVVASYESSFNRKPTVEEWQATLGLVLGSSETQFSCFSNHRGDVDVRIVPADPSVATVQSRVTPSSAPPMRPGSGQSSDDDHEKSDS